MSILNKVRLYLVGCVLTYMAVSIYTENTNRNLMEASLNQLKDGNTLDVQQLMWANNTLLIFVIFGILIFGMLLFRSNINKTLFKDIKSLLTKYKITDIMPNKSRAEELENAYYSYPGYKEKIEEFGLVAFEI